MLRDARLLWNSLYGVFALAVAGRLSDERSLSEAVESLKGVARRFAVTLGARGALLFDGEALLEIPPCPTEAIDTNGAGDMFAGAFLYAITHGEDFPTAGRFASLAASRVVSRYGPRLSASEHDALLEEFFGG